MAQEHVQIAVLVDIPAGERLGVFQVRLSRPDLPAGLIERAPRRTLEQHQPFKLRAQKIRNAVAVEVRDDTGKNQAGRVSTKRFGLVAISLAPAIHQVSGGQDDFRQAIAVEVIENQRVNEVGLLGWRDLLAQDRPEGWFAKPRLEHQMAGIDSFDRYPLRTAGRPIHDEVPGQRGPLGTRPVDQVRGKIKATLLG